LSEVKQFLESTQLLPTINGFCYRAGVGRPPSAAGREAWQLVAELFFGDENHDRFHEACEAIDVSPPQLKAMLSMVPGEPQPMRTLAANWRCDASWVTGIVDGLEERGYAQRRPHQTDRRIKVVELTALGEKAKTKALERLYEPPASLARLSTDEQRTLRDLLRKLREPAP
jgi:DNA-binding MarR family transcriptional regulator